MHSVYEIEGGYKLSFLREEVAAPLFFVSLCDAWKQQIMPLEADCTNVRGTHSHEGMGPKKE